MTNQIAIALAALILGLLLLDHFWLHWGIPLYLGKQFADLVEYLSFWR